MDKLKMHSMNKVDENIEKIGKLFPNCITERKNEKGEVEYAVDFDMLKQELSTVVVEGNEERYQFTWPDKKKSILLANAPIAKTLRPCHEDSVDFDNTENLYIEGDNLDVLKLLQETYLGKIKMIYIDPPYNTGNDFVYNDDFAESADEYLANSGQFDEEGNRLVQNTESNGRFHTDWLNMIYSRLRISKDILADNGLVFISIGQAELNNTITMCDEIFGASNRAGIVSRQMKTGNNQGKFFTQNTDYIVVYSKNVDATTPLKDDMSQDLIDNVYNKVQESGPRKGERYRTMGLFQASLKHGGSTYPIVCPDGERVITPKGLPWRWNETTFKKGLENDDVVFIKSNSSPLINYDTKEKATWNIYTKIWLSSRLEEGQLPSDLILKFENRHAAKELVSLGIPFDFPKPTALLKYILHLITEKDYYVLDFFSGSATTAHAVMQLNAEDGGNRKFIMVQLPEETDNKSAAYKAGYKNICEIGKERIRRAGVKIKEESPLTTANLDTGFRVLKLDSTNMKDVYYNPTDYDLNLFDTLADNIKEDRTPEDLLFQVMLDLGVLLSSKIEESTIGGKKVFNVADGFLYACFDENVTEDVITEIAKKNPYYFVMRDSSMANDSVATNFEQIFATYSPDTVRKVL
jgi:adenine-specific DNA-methyltransferase